MQIKQNFLQCFNDVGKVKGQASNAFKKNPALSWRFWPSELWKNRPVNRSQK